MCLVEVEGARSLVASCATPASSGMVVKSASERVLKFRRRNLQLLLSSGHHYCVTCEADGDCRLQSLAYEYKIDTIDYREARQQAPRRGQHAYHPGFFPLHPVRLLRAGLQ